jgi:hypothetical protein
MGWSVAAILYVLPILAGIRHFDDEVKDCKEWMRSEDGEWFPSLAPWMAALCLALWPIVMAWDAIAPRDYRE